MRFRLCLAIAVSALFFALQIFRADFSVAGVTKSPFGKTSDGTSVERYALKNAKGATVDILTFGGVVQKLIVPDRQGHLADVVLGFDSIEPYEKAGPYFGAIIGRVANRIAGGKFTLDGTTYQIR